MSKSFPAQTDGERHHRTQTSAAMKRMAESAKCPACRAFRPFRMWRLMAVPWMGPL